MKRYLSVWALALVLALGAALPSQAFLGIFEKYQGVNAENGVVAIPLAEVSDGQAHYFSFAKGKERIKFFVLKSSDGVVRAAFDACDVCYESGKGYTQDAEFMVCNNCGMRFHSSRINEVQGGCNPAPLSRGIEGEFLIIPEGALVSGASYFKI